MLHIYIYIYIYIYDISRLRVNALLICLQPGSTRFNTIYVITLVFLLAINKESDRNCFLRIAETETTSKSALFAARRILRIKLYTI